MPVAQQIIKIGPATYCLEKDIGSASYGEIWLARCRESGGQAAIKFVRREKMDAAHPDDQYRWTAALEREIAFLRTIRAPHLVACQRHGKYDGLPVMVLEALYCNLHQIVRRGDAAISLSQSLEWLRQIAEGLRVIHQLGHCHLDLKPKNLLLTPQGVLGRRIKIADFGECLSQQLEMHGCCGTPGWQAPEQFFPVDCVDGKFLYRTTAQTDLYALGLIFYFMVTGKHTHFATEAARIFKEGRDQAAWNARHSLKPNFTSEDRANFFAALGIGSINSSNDLDEEQGTWLPGMSTHSTATVSADQQQVAAAASPGEVASLAALALLKHLLEPDPANRPENSERVLEEIALCIASDSLSQAVSSICLERPVIRI